jgi:radical SAM-linked protein
LFERCTVTIVEVERDVMPKYLFYFVKAESVRWLGHLDILRAFERAVRRAELPIAFTLGFNPRVRINFASALSTGITGSAEPAVIELADAMAADEVGDRLNNVLPPGIRVCGCTEIPGTGKRDLLNAFNHAEYTFICASPVEYTEEQAQDAVTELLALSEIAITREREGRTRTMDIRPMIIGLEFVSRNPENGRLTWSAVVTIGEAGNVRPGDLASALASRLPGLTLRRAHRVRLLTSEEAAAFK